MNLDRLRNIGISAHIDSGKTTLSERILYYCGRIHKMAEVRGNDGGATMDHMELERERGITITSAATRVEWKDTVINLIDTPGHVDFTVEVERSLRVLDGAVLVLCAVGGVQSQSMTVDRQMKRYHVPRLAFINKMDRTGANAQKVCEELREKLKADAVMMQLPMGAGETFKGVIDLVKMKALAFQGDDGSQVEELEIPAEYQDEAEEARAQMLEALSMYSDTMMEMLLSEEEVPEELIHEVLRNAVRHQDLTPVYMGTAVKNKGVQPLLDAVANYLPSPLDREIKARDYDNPDERVALEPDPEKPLVGMAFKIVDEQFGQLTFMRLYQGKIVKGESYYNQRTGKKERFSRILRMHADKREEIDEAVAGDIVAILGVDCASGDTFAAEAKMCSLESMYVPEPVITIAVTPEGRSDSDKLGKALARFRKEDPTFRVSTDEETNEVLISGMGELHLDVYLERIRREYNVQVQASPPKVSYREAPTQTFEFNYKHKKQTGGSGQFAHIVGRIEPLPEDSEETFVFEENVVGGRIPKQYIPSIEKGFRDVLGKGPLGQFPVVGVKVVIEDGSYHEVDSSDKAFQLCAQGCFREMFPKTKPVLLEPIMRMDIECPEEYQGTVAGDLNARRGVIMGTDMKDKVAYITAETPLACTFGYATELRSMTKGQGGFSMELAAYRRMPANVQEEVIEERRKSQLVGT